MPWYPNPISVIAIALSWLCVTLAVLVWRHRSTNVLLSAMLLGDALWLLGLSIGSSVTDQALLLLWFNIQFLGYNLMICGLSILALTFGWSSRWMSGPRAALLCLVPLLGVVLAWSNESHHFLWTVQGVQRNLGVSSLVLRYSAAYASLLIYGFVMLLICGLIFWRKFARAKGVERFQTAILLSGLAFPILGSLVDFSGFSPLPGQIMTLLGFTLMALTTAWAFMGSQLLGIGPTPRSQVVDDMPDAVVMLDKRDRVVDLNQAALRLMGRPLEQVLGNSLQMLFPNDIHQLRQYQDIWSTQEPVQVKLNGQSFHFAMSITPLYVWPRRLYGRTVILRDISDVQEARKRLESLNQRLVSEMQSREEAQAQVLEQQRILATANERERLARDLHDNLGQILGYFNLQASALRELLRKQDLVSVDEELVSFSEVALEAQIQLRDTIRELKSPDLADQERRFFPSLARLADRFEREHKLNIAQQIDPLVVERGFDSLVGAQLLNILQEALNNTAKHAHASRVRLTIAAQAGGLAEICIEDDGVGFNPQDPVNEMTHYGLRFMRERACQAGGELTMRSAPGQGTQILLRLPLRSAAQGETP